MPTTNQHTGLLKSLLGKFVELLYVNDDELERMENFILSKEVNAFPVKDDSEIYEVLFFLRELAAESGYSSIQELSDYFDTQNNSLKKLVEPLLSEEVNDLSGLAIYRIYHDFLKTDAVKLLTTGSYRCQTQILKHGDFVHDLYRHISQNATITKLESDYKALANTTRCFKSLQRYSFEFTLRLTRDRYYEHYLDSFSDANVFKKAILAFLKTVKKIPSIKNLKQILKIRSIINGKKQQRKKIDLLYRQVFEKIRAEQPIENDGFKTLLSQVMLFSKLNNETFRHHIQSLNKLNECENLDKHSTDSDSIAEKVFHTYLSRKKWSILKSPEGHGWITTDNPGFSIELSSAFLRSDHLKVNPYWTDMNADTLMYFPLSKDYCIRLQPSHPDCFHDCSHHHGNISFEVSSVEELKVVNKLVFTSKPDIVISEERGIERLCKRPDNHQKNSCNHHSV